jgi:glutamate--cysteine ligase
LELRSCDAVPPQWYAAPLALVVGIAYDPWARRAATDLLGRPDPDLLRRAGRVGLGDAGISRVAADLADIALAGCGHLGPGYFHPSDLEQARLFFDQYTRRGRSPADDLEEADIAA